MISTTIDPRITESEEYKAATDLEKTLINTVLRLDYEFRRDESIRQYERKQDEISGSFNSGMLVGIPIGVALLACFLILTRSSEGD